MNNYKLKLTTGESVRICTKLKIDEIIQRPLVQCEHTNKVYMVNKIVSFEIV